MTGDDAGAKRRARRYVNYLLAVVFVVMVLGMAIVTVQLILNGV